MISAKEANEGSWHSIQSQMRQHGEAAVLGYEVEKKIQDATARGAYTVSFAVDKTDCHALCRYLQSFGYKVEYVGDRSSPCDTMNVYWSNEVVSDR